MGTDRSLNVWRSRYVRCEERMLVATSLYHLDLSENLGQSIVAARRPPPPSYCSFLPTTMFRLWLCSLRADGDVGGGERRGLMRAELFCSM